MHRNMKGHLRMPLLLSGYRSLDMRVNEQPIEKRTTMYANGHQNLDVHSIFYTIQGEGPFCGTPAVFIRLAGCNLQCPACDTNYTLGREWLDTDKILDIVNQRYQMHIAQKAAPADEIKPYRGLVVITGGEPFRQEIDLLVLKLIQRLGCYVQVETNGTLPPPELSVVNQDINERKGLYIVCSPKSGKVNPKTAAVACCFKYVMASHSVSELDGLPIHALDHKLGTLQVARPPANFKGVIYLQPMDERNTKHDEEHLKACIRSCMKYGYTLQLQVHKILGME